MNIRKSGLLCFAFFLGFFAGGGVKFVYESTTFKQYDWTRKPIVANCYGPDFSEANINKAIYYWNVRGYRSHSYMHDPPKEICATENMIPGFIILREADPSMMLSDTLAMTKRKTSGMKIIAAAIYYRKGSYNLELLSEHELGHAFGFAHVEKDGHVMHPLYYKMGKGFWIP